MRDKTRTTITLLLETADKLSELAKKKGVGKGVYIQKMIDFFEKNNIDYANGDSLMGALVNKEIERVIKILRAYEKTYFKIDKEILSKLENALLGVLNEAHNEISESKQQQTNEFKLKYEDLDSNYSKLKNKVGEVCQKVNNIVKNAEKNRKGYEVVIPELDKNSLEIELEEIIKLIYG